MSEPSPLGRPMLDSVTIKNFRAFKNVTLKKLVRMNVIVGENGVGKTALLEAVFLALAANPQKAVLLRQQRGLDGVFSGTPAAIVEALYSEFFHNMDPSVPAEIIMKGSGPEARSLVMSQGRGDLIVPIGARADEAAVLSPIEFAWTDSEGVRTVAQTRVSGGGVEFESAGSVPNCYFFSATSSVPSGETATKFSDLRKRRKTDAADFVRTFTEIFDWIEDISVETYGGAPVLHAAVRGADRLMPLTTVSGAINRIAGILLAIADRRDGLVLVDEIENGIFHRHQLPLAKALVSFSRKHNCQLLMSTHSLEWLEAFILAAGDPSDSALYRVERGDPQPSIVRFGGETFAAGVRSSGDVR